MEVVTVVVNYSKSASDVLMERLFNPTLNRKSAEVCAVPQVGVSKNNYNYKTEKAHVSLCILSVYTPPFGLWLCERQVGDQKTFYTV